MRLAQRADKHFSDHIGEIATWPKWARQLALAPLLDKRARFTLTTFLLGNRVPPIVIAEFMVTMLRDYSACLDVATMLDKYRRGNIHPSVKYWDGLHDEHAPWLGSGGVPRRVLAAGTFLAAEARQGAAAATAAEQYMLCFRVRHSRRPDSVSDRGRQRILRMEASQSSIAFALNCSVIRTLLRLAANP